MTPKGPHPLGRFYKGVGRETFNFSARTFESYLDSSTLYGASRRLFDKYSDHFQYGVDFSYPSKHSVRKFRIYR